VDKIDHWIKKNNLQLRRKCLEKNILEYNLGKVLLLNSKNKIKKIEKPDILDTINIKITLNISFSDSLKYPLRYLCNFYNLKNSIIKVLHDTRFNKPLYLIFIIFKMIVCKWIKCLFVFRGFSFLKFQ
jgi:hypothetical protein